MVEAEVTTPTEGAPAAPEAPANPPTLLEGATPPATGENAEGSPKGEEQTETDAKPKGAPEKYEFAAPEGMTLDSAILAKFEPLARELDLDQDKANKLVGLYAEHQHELARSQAEAWGQQVASWGEQVKADKAMGGENLPVTLKAATTFMDWLGMPELKSLMALATPENPTGLGIGNHPVLVAAFAKAGKAMAEDVFHTGSSEGKPDISTAQKFYQNMNP